MLKAIMSLLLVASSITSGGLTPEVIEPYGFANNPKVRISRTLDSIDLTDVESKKVLSYFWNLRAEPYGSIYLCLTISKHSVLKIEDKEFLILQYQSKATFSQDIIIKSIIRIPHMKITIVA